MSNPIKVGELSIEQIRSLSAFLNQVLEKDNILYQARKRTLISQKSLASFGDERCSYCGMPFASTSKEIMPDGRIRCPRCSKTGIETTEELQRIYKTSRNRFEKLFQVRLPYGIHIEMKPASEQRREKGEIYPAPGQTGGFIKDARGYSIWLDYGISSLSVIQMLAIIFTRVWQNENWDPERLKLALGAGMRPDVNQTRQSLEKGMALWASVQFLLASGETDYAAMCDSLASAENLDGISYLEFKKEFPFQYSSHSLRTHPFHAEMPVNPSVLFDYSDRISS